ncbi:MAG TPA: cyclic pyranopterin monophosphate synthase MoaC [Gammaproteobacteria bacterium]|nr:cyclic pyranopterin monophosphate synthase MoaC [Gammaproteobacteria bacterium]HIK70669.1 cyclic pyranopterin monophosphate synthase MoaC [Pseudomonadales bacterium]
MPENDLTHIDRDGNARMVDVGNKHQSQRNAHARGEIRMSAATLAMIIKAEHKKGDVLTVAKIAGIQAAKHCSDLIPLCHSLALTGIDLRFEIDPDEQAVQIEAECRCNGPTGVEMEALTAVSVAALTIYDMCKAVDRSMIIGEIKLQQKSGGRSGDWSSDSD